MSRPSLRVVTTPPDPLAEKRATFDPDTRGYVLTYRPGENIACPGCSRRQWHIGRLMAECAWCGCAVGLAGNG